MIPVAHPADGRLLKGFDPGQNFVRQRRKGHRVDPIEIAGHLQNLAMIQTKSFILECEQDPVHPYSYRKVQSHPETRPYAGQYGRMLPVMVAEIDDENAARIQPRTAIAVKLRRTELRGLPVPVEAIDKQDVAAPFVPSYEFGAVIADDLEAIAFGRQEELLANGNDLGIDLDRRSAMPASTAWVFHVWRNE